VSCEELPQGFVGYGQVRFNAVAHPARPGFSVALEAQVYASWPWAVCRPRETRTRQCRRADSGMALSTTASSRFNRALALMLDSARGAQIQTALIPPILVQYPQEFDRQETRLNDLNNDHRFEIQCDAGDAGCLHARTNSVSVRVGQRIRRNGLGDMGLGNHYLSGDRRRQDVRQGHHLPPRLGATLAGCPHPVPRNRSEPFHSSVGVRSRAGPLLTYNSPNLKGPK
jgi:hypothetical protein